MPWYVQQNGRRAGPFSSEQLKRLAAAGKLRPTDLVCVEGATDWRPASVIKGLFASASQHAAPAARTATYSQTSVATLPSWLQAAWQQRQKWAGTAGCLGLLGMCLLCGTFGSLVPRPGSGPPATLQGDTVHVELRLHTGTALLNNLELAARRTAELVYQAAKQHPAATQVVVTVSMSKTGVQDKYGNPLTEDQPMGTITVTDLAEVRRYREAGAYQLNPQVEARFMFEIRRMPHAHLLDR